MNPYETLGIPIDATAADIRKAYRKLSKTLHPDAGGGVDEFQKLSSAYDILSDKERRRKYDDMGITEENGDQAVEALKELFFMLVSQLNDIDIDAVDLLGIMKQQLSVNINQCQQQINQLTFNKVKLSNKIYKLKKRLKAKKQNFLLDILDTKLKTFDQPLSDQQKNIDLYQQMVLLLNDFNYETMENFYDTTTI